MRRSALIPAAILALTFTGCGPNVPPRSDAGRDGGDSRDGGVMDAGDPRPVDGGDPSNDAAPIDAGADAGGCAVDCSAIEAPPCMTSVCSGGDCVMMPLPDDTTCDDGDFCTVGETCSAGACTGGAPHDCAGTEPGACQEVVCDSTAAACRVRGSAALNGTPCTYPDLCVSGTTCMAGTCTGGTRLDCPSMPAPNDCQMFSCNPATGACELFDVREGDTCADPTNPCIIDSTCSAGACGGGSTLRDCSAMDAVCAAGVCDPTDGSCVAMPVGEGTPCDDGMSCTADTVCTGGVCAGGSSPACSLTPDSCCPGACNETDDADCACPGELVGATCVYLPSTVSAASQTAARAACTALGTGWNLCGPSLLCMPQVLTYLADSGCGCTGGAATCACGSAANLYVHVDGASPYYVRGPSFPGCLTTMSCTDSVSESCGVPLCCR